MPIRFRCAYCNQLLGIAHRKAGRVVRCPTCSGQVVVPNPDPERDEAEEIPPANPNLFEANDLDDVLALPQPALAGNAPPAQGTAPSGAWGTHGEPAYVPPRPAVASPPAAPPPTPAPPPKVVPAPLPPGIFLSPTRATLVLVGGILALAAAFGAGLLVGKFLLN